MKANGNSKKLKLVFRIFLWLNVLNSIALIGGYLGTHISPNTISYLPFLGLAYPFLLLINLLFILLWLFIRVKFIWISILSILLGFNHLRHFIAFTVFENKIENPITIMSYNVRIFDFFNLENRDANRNEIFSFLDKESPDIICFQEFFHQERSDDFETRDSLIKLLEITDLHEHYTHNMALSRYFGLATFSRFPIIHRGEIGFDNDANNFCIYSDMIIHNDTIRVFNGHIGSIRFQNDDYNFFGDEGNGRYLDREGGHQIVSRLKVAFEKRAKQAEKIVEEIDRSPYPVIICMDMNDTPVSYAYNLFEDRLYDAFVESGNGIGTTYIGEMPSNRIDYIFYSKTLKSAHFKTHQIDCSDHKPISCEIGFDLE